MQKCDLGYEKNSCTENNSKSKFQSQNFKKIHDYPNKTHLPLGD